MLLLLITFCYGQPHWIPKSASEVWNLVSCRWLSAERVNSWPREVCAGLSAYCLNDFDVTELEPRCAGQMPAEEYELLSAETVRQLLSIDPLIRKPDPRLLRGLLRRAGGTNWSPILRHYVVRNADLVRQVLDGASKRVLALFFNSPNLRSMDPKIMGEFVDSELIQMLGEDALSMLTPSHLQVFDREMFASISPEQFRNLPPAVFVEFTSEHASWMRPGHRQAMTVAQMFSLGREPLEILQLTRAAQRGQHARLELRMVLEEEPCMQMIRHRGEFAPNVCRVLEERCETAMWAWDWLEDDLLGRHPQGSNGHVPKTFHAFPVIAIACSFSFFVVLIVIVCIFSQSK